jgi:hypothetical protein
VSTGPYEFGRRDGFDPQCCATCRFAVLHGGHGSHAVRRYCNLRRAWLPFKQRERLRMFGCDGFERDAASAEAIAQWARLTPDEDGWSERDFARLR